MKTLQNYTILYDEACPMCSVYTRVLADTGVIEKDGRVAYQEMPQRLCPLVDQQRAVNEIALIDNETGEVTYGIYSLFRVIGHSWPVFGPLFRFKPFGWVMSKVYAFISYNRRVIVPPSMADEHSFQPTFKLHYRLAYLLFTWFVTAYILSRYATLMTGMLPGGSVYREYLVCGGQLLFQAIVLFARAKTGRIWEYLGNMMTISFSGALVLLPGMFIATRFDLPSVFAAVYFMGTAFLMFLEHYRRMKILGLGWVPTATWVVYRLLVLILILLV